VATKMLNKNNNNTTRARWRRSGGFFSRLFTDFAGAIEDVKQGERSGGGVNSLGLDG